MAKHSGFSNPTTSSSGGGLLGGFAFEHNAKYEFSPRVVVIFSLISVFIIFILFQTQ